MKFRHAALWVMLLSATLACGRAAATRQDAPPAGRPSPSPTPAAQQYPSLKKQAEAAAQAFDSRDFRKLASLTYPKLVTMMGGPEGMEGILKREIERAEAEGVHLLPTTVGEPAGVTPIGARLYATVPTRVRMRTSAGVAAGEAFMLGISDDGGRNWTFIDGSGGRNEEKMRTLLPEAAGKLKLPELKPLVMEKDN